MVIQGLNEAAQREAKGLGSIVQNKKLVRYVEGAQSWDWNYPTPDLAAASVRLARKRANAN